MRYIVLGISLIVSLVLQSTILNSFQIIGNKPDLVLIIVILSTLFYGQKEGTKLGFIFGFIEDVFLCKYLGLNAVTKMLTAYLIGLSEDKIYKENFLVPIIGLFLSTIINNFLYILISGLANVNTNIVIHIWYTTLPQAIYNTIVACLIYPKFYSEVTKGILKIRK